MELEKTILVVEDDPINRKIIRKILSPYFNVVEAENGLVGINLVKDKRETISAVVLDLVMPIMDGYEFLKQITSLGYSDLPIIVTTGSSGKEAENIVLDYGAWDYVLKPYNGPVLVKRLNNAIARSEIEAYRKLEYISSHDPLTGLLRDTVMFKETARLLESNQDKEFVFGRLDIEHFIDFISSFGEEKGNDLIKFVAKNILDFASRKKYCVIGRMSNDTFCICCEANKDEDFSLYVEELQRRVSTWKKDYFLAIRMGICFVNQDNYLPEDLYHKATVALAKCNNQYNKHLEFYDAESGAKTKQEQFVQNEMKNALLTNQFVLYYQPKFDLATETICGSEALVRWRHPERGLIQPGIFIPVFENNGFISKLDIYVWEETCKAIKKWTDEGRKVYPVSVNVSRVSLYNPNLTSVIKGIVDKYGIDISLFQLEITESAYMSNPQLMEATINSLRKEGFAILMDDFGSGYSSLNTLKSIFIDALKIDMKFLPFDKNQKRSKMILSCVIQMAKLLKIYVISEGVENVEQRDFLKENGCDAIQGYFYSRPIPEDEFEEKYLIKENDKK